jgi:hypothetical protein
MKNIDVTYLNVDDALADELDSVIAPKGSMFKTSPNNNDGWRKHYHSEYHDVEDRSPRLIALHVYRKFKGKNVNDAFSYYCSLVPVYMQNRFWKDIEKNKEDAIKHKHWWKYNYYIDTQNRIQEVRKKPYNSKIPFYVNKREEKIKTIIYYHKPKRGFGRRLAPEVIEVDIVHYDKKVFPGDRKYVQMEAEKRKHKLYKPEEKEYDFNRLKRLKKANEEDKLIRDRHGFDDNSFVGIEYHGGKRKRDKLKISHSSSEEYS